MAVNYSFQLDEKRQHVEVCPEGGVTIQNLANRIAEDGGAALIADYGHDGIKTDTFRVSGLNINRTCCKKSLMMKTFYTVWSRKL